MTPFRYYRAKTLPDALAAAVQPGARIIAGGTNLVDHMKLGIETPSLLIDITAIPDLNAITDLPDGGLRIGAMARNTDIAAHVRVKRDYAVLSRAIVSGASGQVRNMASASGNLLQRTRCPYFYDPNLPCNKRNPGSGCGALAGFSRNHAAAGGSGLCICPFPSDMSVALLVLDASVEIARADGTVRTMDIADFHLPPGDELPVKEFALGRGEIITAIILPPPPGGRHVYRKVRDRASFAFALVSVAAVIQPDGSGRVALGGVGTKPWRSASGDAALPKGAKAVAAALFAEAVPQPDNAYKLVLAERTIAAVLVSAKGARS